MTKTLNAERGTRNVRASLTLRATLHFSSAFRVPTSAFPFP